MLTHQITLHLPEKIVQEINRYKISTHQQTIEEAVTALLHYALTSLPPYFQNFDWERAELEADDEIQTGRVQTFYDVDELLADLKT